MQDQANKAQEIIYRLSLKPDFQADLKKIRGNFGIPENGFGVGDDFNLWHKERAALLEVSSGSKKVKRKFKLNNPLDYDLNVANLLRKYNVLSTKPIREILDLYVLSGEILPPFSGGANVACFVTMPSEAEVQERGRPFVRLVIESTASQDDVVAYVRKAWKSIKYALDVQAESSAKIIRKTNNRERDRRILELNTLSKKKLEEMAKAPAPYKEGLIAKILKGEGWNVSEALIKKVIQRSKKKYRDI